MYQLLIKDDAGQTTKVPVQREQLGIGRKEDNAIRLTERNVSRHHARLVRDGGAIYVEDLSSYTGTRLNGKLVQGRTALGEGDRLQIGDYELAVQEISIAAPPPQQAQPQPLPQLQPQPQRTMLVPVVTSANSVKMARPGYSLAVRLGVFIGVACACGLTLHGQLAHHTALPQRLLAMAPASPPRFVPVPPSAPVLSPSAHEAPSGGGEQIVTAPAQAPQRKRHQKKHPDDPPGTQPDPQPLPEKETPSKSELSAEEADQILRDAQTRYVNGDFATAMKLAHSVSSAGGASATRAWRIVGAAACNTQDGRMIHAAYQHVDTSSRQYVLYVCLRAGMVYSGGQFKLAEADVQ